MKPTKIQTEFESFDKYRVTYHSGCRLIEIEVKTYKTKLFGKKWYWKRIYIGHPTPIEKSIEFYKESKDKDNIV